MVPGLFVVVFERGFRPSSGRLTLSWQSKQTVCSWFRPLRGPLPPALLRGSPLMGRPWPKRLTGRPGPFPPCATPPLGLHKSRSASPAPSRMKSRARAVAVAVALLRNYHRRHRSRLGRRPSGGVAESGSEAGMPSQRRWARDGPSARPDGGAPPGGNPAGAQPGASGLVTLPRQSNPARRGSEPL